MKRRHIWLWALAVMSALVAVGALLIPVFLIAAGDIAGLVLLVYGWMIVFPISGVLSIILASIPTVQHANAPGTPLESRKAVVRRWGVLVVALTAVTVILQLVGIVGPLHVILTVVMIAVVLAAGLAFLVVCVAASTRTGAESALADAPDAYAAKSARLCVGAIVVLGLIAVGLISLMNASEQSAQSRSTRPSAAIGDERRGQTMHSQHDGPAPASPSHDMSAGNAGTGI